MINRKKAVVFGIHGLSLSAEEKVFFKEINPLGFIFFKRNIKDKEQFLNLISEIKEVMDRDDILFMIDQEGGRVQRFTPPIFKNHVSAFKIGNVYDKSKKDGERLAYLTGALIGFELYELGINVNCAPVLDLYFEGMSDVIGDRAFSKDVDTVITLSKNYAKGLIDAGVTPVIKHIPGHGRSNKDTHKNIVHVDTDIRKMEETDFVPFKEFDLPAFGMMSHIVYDGIDKKNPATLSKKVKKVIKENIGFKGLIFSDDFSMQALTNFDESFEELAKKALDRAVDVVLHCNGDMNEMKKISLSIKNLCNRRKKIIKETMVKEKANIDMVKLEKEYEDLYAKYFN